jgi:hypothetical protein
VCWPIEALAHFISICRGPISCLLVLVSEVGPYISNHYPESSDDEYSCVDIVARYRNDNVLASLLDGCMTMMQGRQQPQELLQPGARMLSSPSERSVFLAKEQQDC